MNKDNFFSNPILSSKHKLKLAVFGLNVSSGCSMTDMSDTLKINWKESVSITKKAEKIGFEAIIPVARWRGMGGQTDFNHRNFETFTWAAGLSAVTDRIAILATSHVPTVHPVRAAKEVVTIDHISGGRFGLNIVAGWNAKEFSMFGIDQLDHDERYKMAEDWIELCKKLWNDKGEFEFNSTYFNAKNLYSEPKPIQKPYPLLMSAGNSERGQHYAAKHCDINFVVAPDIESAGKIAKNVKKIANEIYNRDIQVFGQAYLVCRKTEQEAKDYVDHYVNKKGDWEGVRNLLDILIPNSQSALGEEWNSMAENMIAGYGAIPLVGTKEQIVEGMKNFSDSGLDGITLSWVNYEFGLDQFELEILPLLIKANLRNKYS
jgi:alkanesulfonate monooxygenase SsuD/methylene tetrahydromethanopterin reductase-like flavin-dependent oxidoreductase (luciferase family)